MASLSEQINFKSKNEDKREVSKDLPKAFPSDAPRRMHKSYYENNIDGIRELYETQGIKIPSHFNDVESYIDYRVSQKAYGGKVQPRGAYRSTETR
jgi:hypothetical protein